MTDYSELPGGYIR